MADPEAVIFDLDGLLLESEQVWDEAKRRLVSERGGRWAPEATQTMLGMSSTEWAIYMRDGLGVPLDPAQISAEVVRIMGELYERELPVLPGAGDAVARLAARWPVGLASSSNREIIDTVLETAGWTADFQASVSSEEVDRGKPAPDVYLEAARRLDAAPGRCVAVEDSAPGINSAAAAGLAVIAVPNASFPPDADALDRAAVVLDSLHDLSPATVEQSVGHVEREES
jgi:HAD superfamily hydrolase (TIGR01509 family)